MVEQLPLIALPESRRGEWLGGFVIHGEPQRSKHHCTCRGKHPSTRPDPGWKTWRDEAVESLRLLAPAAGWHFPVLAQVVAVFQRPKNRRRTYTMNGVEYPWPWAWTDGRIGFVGKPDADQVQKAAVDVVVQAGILLDDSLAEPVGTERWYTAVGEQPRTEVRFWRAT